MIEFDERNSLEGDSVEILENEQHTTECVEEKSLDKINDDSEVSCTENNDAENLNNTSNKAPSWVKELRKSHREKEKKIKELENQIKLFNQEKTPNEQIRKPTLEDCDYDEDVFSQKMEVWILKCENEKTLKNQKEDLLKKETEDFNRKVEKYQNQKQSLNIDDFDDCEWAVENTLSNIQQGIIVQSAENPALLVYTLGKNQEKLNFLSSITDPVQFAFEVGKMELKAKQLKSSTSISVDMPLKTNGVKANSHNSVLDNLRLEAEKTGDYTKVVQYKTKNKI
jgi:hypothetical protein